MKAEDLCTEAVSGSGRGTKWYKVLRSAVLDAVSSSVHDVLKLHIT